MKKIISLLLLSTTLITVGCTKKVEDNPKTNGIISSGTDETTSNYTPFTLTDKTTTPSPFSFLGNSLAYPNWEENGRISLTKTPDKTSKLISSNTNEQFDYYTSSLVLIEDTIYFADGSKENALSSLNITTKSSKQLNSNSVHMLSSYEDNLYYINHKDQKLYSYNTSSNKGGAISLDKVGKYIINGNFILYQNLSDNSKLYKIKLDGSNRQALTNYSVDSFSVFQNELIVSNSTDNNYIYHIDPMTLESKRLLLLNAHNIKGVNDKLYFLNGDDSNSLCELNINFKEKKYSYTKTLNENIEDYFLSNIGIFYKRAADVNTPYFLYTVK